MKTALKYFRETCEAIEKDGLTKNEKIMVSPQGARVRLQDGRELINMCANNHLGLANDPQVMEAARQSYEQYGCGLSSVRFVCGTQQLHKALEAKVAARSCPKRIRSCILPASMPTRVFLKHC